MRILRGRYGYWCLTPSGRALIPPSSCPDGQVSDSALGQLTRAGLLATHKSQHYGLTVMTSTACNLGCAYCFQNTGAAAVGKFNPPRIESRHLPERLLPALVDFTRRQMDQGSYSRLQLLLFGGEPLINAKACLSTLRTFHDNFETTSSMVTNGVLLRTRLVDDLAAAGLKSLQVTLDGTAATHDVSRHTRSGRGTFATIVDNLEYLVQKTTIRATIRVNVTDKVAETLPELMRELTDKFAHSSMVVDLAPVRDYEWNVESLAPTDVGAIISNVRQAVETVLDSGLKMATPAAPDCTFCAEIGGTGGAVVAPDGQLYSSWETAGRPGYEVGTVAEGYAEFPPDVWQSCEHFADHHADDLSGVLADQIDTEIMDAMYAHQA